MIFILIISNFLQLFAAWYALTLIKTTGKVKSWLCISIASILMIIRRSVTLYQVVFANGHIESSLDWIEELIALLTSFLMAAGIIWIAPIFKSIQSTNQSLKRSNRALKALSSSNQIIVRATDELKLMNEICQVIVEIGGYRMAWVGITMDEATKNFHLAAQYGVADRDLDQAIIAWNESKTGMEPAGTAIRTGKTTITREIDKIQNTIPGKRKHLREIIDHPSLCHCLLIVTRMVS
ncbi:MAG: GAF domain-containing protein [Anaerolineaceae bacterium]